MRAGLGTRVERYAPTALAAAFALGALIEDAVKPVVTVGGRRYDRGPEAAMVIALCAAVVLVAFLRRLGALGPLSALAALGLAALPAPAWLLTSSFIYLLVMFACALSGYFVVGRLGLLGLVVVWFVASLAEWRNPEHSVTNWLAVGAFMSIAWGVGLLARRSVSQARSAEQRASRFEQEQEDAARRAVTEERQRIARELHDITKGVHHLPVSLVSLGLGTVVSGACYGLLGVAVGALARNTVAAVIGGIVGIQVLEVAVLESAAPSFAKWLPIGAARGLTSVGSTRSELGRRFRSRGRRSSGRCACR